MIEGVATTIPADLAILAHPDFAAIEHSTKWVEDDARPLGVTSKPRRRRRADRATSEPKVRRDVDVEVNGKRFSVAVWVPESQLAPAAGRPAAAKPPAQAAARGAAARRPPPGSGKIAVPMQGTIVKVLVAVGDDGRRGRGGLRARGHEDGEQHHRRQGRHRRRGQGRARPVGRAPARSS